MLGKALNLKMTYCATCEKPCSVTSILGDPSVASTEKNQGRFLALEKAEVIVRMFCDVGLLWGANVTKLGHWVVTLGSFSHHF